MKESEKEQVAQIKKRMKNGKLVDQPCWSFIRELNFCSEERQESIAIRNGYRTYNYRQLVYQWERYASAFSGINLTGKNRSRVALIGTPLTETIFAFYGLNMTGASISLIYPFDLFDENQIYSMIQKEKITDLVISEYYAFPRLMRRLLRLRELLGIRNIILLESPMGGKFGIPVLEAIRQINKELFREMPGGLLMEDLLVKYEAYPISYGKGKAPIILHTTGTVSGMHKPVPLTDEAMNSFVVSAIRAKKTFEDFQNAPEHMITYLTLNMSWVYAMVDMLHTPLGLGMEIVSLPFGATNPFYGEAIEHYGINVLFTSKSILDSWLKTMPDIDLTRLKIVFMGGTYVSPEYKKKFNDYLWSCGSSARIINGYGLSEMGGACTLAPTSREDDAIGFLMPGFKAKIYVEEENRYYDIEEGPRTGVLLLNSPTMSSGRLDDTVFFELERIDKEDYFNTNDLVRVNEDGSLTCIGRSNQFFINNAGVRFDAGLVQNAVSAQPGVAACGVVPEFHKTLHDNIPVLYVQMNESGAAGLADLHRALIQVFILDELLAESNLPGQVVLTEKIPLNSSGKVDAKMLAAGAVKGERFSVKPVRLNGKVSDILLIPAAEGENATMGAGIPEELEGDPYNILSELFGIIPELNEGHYSKLFQIPGLQELVEKLTGFDIKDIPKSLKKTSPKLYKLAYQKYLMPFMEGVIKMNKMDWKFPGFENFGFKMPKMDNWDWAQDLVGNMFAFWDQMTKMEDYSIAACKKQWNQFFDYMMEMQDTASALLPENVTLVPGLPFSVNPKEYAEKMKEFQEMANKHFTAQADSINEFRKDSEEKVRDLVDSNVKNVAKQVKKVVKPKEAPKAEEAAEEVKAEEPKAEEAPKAAEKKEAPKAAEKKEAPKAAEKKEAPKAAEKKEAPKAAEKKEAPKAAEKKEAPKAEEKK